MPSYQTHPLGGSVPNNDPLGMGNLENDDSVIAGHCISGVYAPLKPIVWERELVNDTDLDYLLDGVTNGFKLIDCDVNLIKPYETDNYASAESLDAKPKLDKLICSEILQGKINPAEEKPTCIHAYGAVPKKGTEELRPITDCSRPYGRSIHDHIEYPSMKFSTVDSAIKLMTPGCYFAVVDISKAYRSVPVHPTHRKLQGFKWMFGPLDSSKYCYFNFLCFGLSCAPGIFARISNSINRMMKRRGFKCVVNYLGDFLIIGGTYEECQVALSVLINLLISLGFSINWNKVCGPSTTITFLGVTLDSILMQSEIPYDKIC